MELRHEVVGLGRYDRTGLDDLALALPVLPQAGKSKGLAILPPDVDRLLPATLLLPLVEPVRWDQAAPVLEGPTKCWLARDGFRPCVNHPVADGRVVVPPRAYAPRARHTLPLPGSLVPPLAPYLP